jgi:hypothetical protein
MRIAKNACPPRQMQERAIALCLRRVETQPLVEIIEPYRLQIVDSADRESAADHGERHRRRG